MENKPIFPPATPEMSKKRADLAPGITEAFRNWSKEVFKAGALDEKTKQIIAVAVAHVTQCPYCIKGHTKIALRKGRPIPSPLPPVHFHCGISHKPWRLFSAGLQQPLSPARG